MSCTYAEGLSEYDDKGVLGLPEIFDPSEEVKAKVKILVSWIAEANHIVVHTGAGISTSAGVPDFRGPNGVWTLEKIGQKPKINSNFDDTKPTITHMALKKLVDENKVNFVVSQNIDGLHLRSGLPRNKLSELHGNMYVEECNRCHRQFILNSATSSVGKKFLGYSCKSSNLTGRSCRGRMHDTILDWEHDLPGKDLELAEMHSSMADLNICLGTTLQIIPSGNLPLNNKKYGGKLVICNLQPTKKDKQADLVIHTYVDDIFRMLAESLDLKIPEYSPELDPTKANYLIECTLRTADLRIIRNLYKTRCNKIKINKSFKRKHEEMEDKCIMSEPVEDNKIN